MTRRQIQTLAGAVGGAATLALLAAGIFRVYGPGDLAERIGRLRSRWAPFFDPPGDAAAYHIWRFIGQGLLITLEVALISMALSLVFGIALGVMRLSRSREAGFNGSPALAVAVSAPAAVLVQAIRSSPLFMLILYTFIAAPRLGLNLGPMAAGIFALTLYTSCVLAEIVRAGVLSLERGQFEAADALGLGYFRKLRFVVLPQALRRMVPSLVSQLVTLLKDTSLLTNITLIELLRRTTILSQQYFNPLESMAVAAAIYFSLNFTLSTLARRLEERPARVAAGPVAAAEIGAEDQTRLV